MKGDTRNPLFLRYFNKKTSDIQPDFQCCGKFLYTEDDLKNHLIKYHPEDLKEFKEYFEQKETVINTKRRRYLRILDVIEDKRFICSRCGQYSLNGFIVHYPQKGTIQICKRCEIRIRLSKQNIVRSLYSTAIETNRRKH